MGYPFFNPPNTQKVNVIEHGQYFVATKGIEPKSVTEELSSRQRKIRRFVRMGLIALGVAVFVALAWWFISGVL